MVGEGEEGVESGREEEGRGKEEVGREREEGKREGRRGGAHPCGHLLDCHTHCWPSELTGLLACMHPVLPSMPGLPTTFPWPRSPGGLPGEWLQQ